MNFKGATAFLTLATPALTHGFHVAGKEGASRGVSSLAARRASLFQIRRRDPFFRDMDQMMEEIDTMMDESLAMLQRPLATPQLRRPLGGFDVSQDENEYRVSIAAPGVDVNDLSLSLDNDGRVLRLKGQASSEEGGMVISSRFEKAVLLSPEVDTDKITASISDGTLTVVAPKINPTSALEQAQAKKIEIRIDEPTLRAQPSLDGSHEEVVVDNDDTMAETNLATEDPKVKGVTGKGGEDANEKENCSRLSILEISRKGRAAGDIWKD